MYLKLYKQTFKNVLIKNREKYIEFNGSIGYVKKYFGGKDIIFINDKYFLYSKKSYKNFLSICLQLLEGVQAGYIVELKFVGLGYRFLKFKNYLLLKIGYSHYIKFLIPEGTHCIGYKKRLIIVGLSLCAVHSLASILCTLKKKDVYKGKGILLLNEIVKLKIGKQK